MKPLFRWTHGSTTQQGFDILQESVFRTIRALGEDNFDWMICYNGLDSRGVKQLEYIVQNRPIELVEQSWDDCPIPDKCWSPIKEDGTIEVDGKKCGGTMWKVCPARMRMDGHEIVMDNDIVILKMIPALKSFLESDRTLILDEPYKFYGRYSHLFDAADHLNSGLMGLPPGYDFREKILCNWEEQGFFHGLTHADEQGLLMYTLKTEHHFVVKKDIIREFLAKDEPLIQGDEYGIHFTQANRTTMHRAWLRYQEIMRESIKMI